MDGDDDSFRGAGSPYEHAPAQVIAAVRLGEFVDWGAKNYRPTCLWLPEPLFDWLAGITSLRNVDRRDQPRLDPTKCARLEAELLRIRAAPLPDAERTAAGKVLRRVREVQQRPGSELIIEGF